MENNKPDKNDPLPYQDKKNSRTIVEMEWFNRFENKPGIYDIYTINELKDLNKKMLKDLKKKINGID